MTAHHKNLRTGAEYDGSLPCCPVCDQPVDLTTGGKATRHDRLVQRLGARVAVAEPCTGSGMPAKEPT